MNLEIKNLYNYLIFFLNKSKNKKKKEEDFIREKKTSQIIKNIFKSEIVVLNGPFKGMKYISSSNGSQLLPKLIGSYEEPIHKWIFEILNNGKYETIIDVGCAEGYYAVGLTQAKSSPNILAFDLNNLAIENAKKLAYINNVSNSVQFFNNFEISILKKIFETNPNQKVLIFMDVEGDEENLLNTINFPIIKDCDILVEVHDCFYPGITNKLISYFSQTHKIEIVIDYPWREFNYSFNNTKLSSEEVFFIYDERRLKDMKWLYAKRK
jgi:hypothetical protein